MNILSKFCDRLGEVVLLENPQSPHYEVELRQPDGSYSRKLISTDDLDEAEELLRLVVRHLLHLGRNEEQTYRKPVYFRLSRSHHGDAHRYA
jgi:hypothetical protein